MALTRSAILVALVCAACSVKPLPEDRIVFACGPADACGLTDDDRLFCWGRNDKGQVGLSPRDFRMPGVITLP